MTQTAIAKTNGTGVNALEQVLLNGDLTALSPQDRILYYQRTCDSLGLNPLTKPFEYIKLNGKLTLYARKDATDQLRKIHGVSIAAPDIQQIDNLIIVTVVATDKNGRTDSDIGVVGKGDMGGNVGNALMKAVTKAKRRVTLSICGLGMLDETEVETIPNAQPVPVEVAQAEVDSEREGLIKHIRELIKACKAQGDELLATPAAITAFINEFCEVEGGMANVPTETLPELKEELEMRLEALLNVTPETADESEVF